MPENAWPQRMIEKPTENEITFEPINQMGKKWDFDLMEITLKQERYLKTQKGTSQIRT